MLETFHENVSNFRTCRYDIFKRHAYDKDYIASAYPKWEEGIKFYDKIFNEKESTPYLLQQAALYLSGRKQHALAFQYIDRAIALGGDKNWTILNSHAIILFRANISFAHEPGARETLDRSMSILSRCYYSDRRKAFHAKIFADHSMQYWNVYADEQAMKYLEKADGWLEDQAKWDPWDKGVKKLSRQVKLCLAKA